MAFQYYAITVQDRPRRSLWLLSGQSYTPIDAGVRRRMRLGMRLTLIRPVLDSASASGAGLKADVMLRFGLGGKYALSRTQAESLPQYT